MTSFFIEHINMQDMLVLFSSFISGLTNTFKFSLGKAPWGNTPPCHNLLHKFPLHVGVLKWRVYSACDITNGNVGDYIHSCLLCPVV